jgi:hypothetical protein
MLRRIVESGNVPGLANPRQTLRDIGLLVRNRDGCKKKRQPKRLASKRGNNFCVAQIGWEQRGNHRYYYRKERPPHKKPKKSIPSSAEVIVERRKTALVR